MLNYIKSRLSLPWIGAPGNQAIDELGIKIARRAALDIGICEDPTGSNRGKRIDEYNTSAGVALGSYWCASASGSWYKESGAKVPSGYASCDNWLAYLEKYNLRRSAPCIGGTIIYGIGRDAQHIGVVVRLVPYVMTIEANTTLDGYSRNGEAITIKVPKFDRFITYGMYEARE
jgi:hypothetical protein